MVVNPDCSTVQEKRLSLTKFLQERPPQQELIDKNILKDPKVAPALQGHAEELKRAQLEAMLAHKIEKRPDISELVDHNILHDPNVAPALQDVQAKLKRSQLEDSLNNKIQSRPAKEDLVERHILDAAPIEG